MKWRAIFSTRPANLLALLNGAGAAFRRELDRELKTIGENAVNRIKRDFRMGGTTLRRTAVRSARLINSYGSDVRREGDRVALEAGAIRPTDGGKVPLHARIQEGFDRRGRPVDEFEIRPVNAKNLRFPIRRGGGLAKSNIVAWVSTKGPILLKPTRQALPTIAREIPIEAERRAMLVFRRVLVGSHAA